MGECSKESAFAILDAFYENGGNFIDTYVLGTARLSEQ
jgi:aryl-alcohol dehydrogenase-like predicted oxidoreductase